MLMPLLWKEISYCKSEVSKRGKADNVNMLQLHDNLDIKKPRRVVLFVLLDADKNLLELQVVFSSYSYD